MKLWLALLLFLQQPAVQPAPTEPTGSIEGSVFRADTNQPLAGAQIVLTQVTAGGTRPAPPPPPGTAGPPGQSTTADEAGKFMLRNLPAGSYRVVAMRDGFTLQEYGAREPGRTGMGTIVTVAGSDTIRNIVVRLAPTGSVNGRITGPAGAPLMRLDVMLLRASDDSRGNKTFEIVSSAQTDDRGQYRLYWITPGSYYLTAGPSLMRTPFLAIVGGRTQKQVTTFYPGVTDAAIALTIEVKGGVELSGIDFPLRQVLTYRIRGRVAGQTTGIPNITVNARQPMPAMIIMAPQGTPVDAEGFFELNDVAPGQYWVRAQIGTPALPMLGGPPADSPTAAAAVDVVSDDIENLVLSVVPPVTISGRVTVEGNPPPADVRLSIGLSPALLRDYFAPSYAPAPLNPDGTFVQTKVFAGDYRWFAGGIPANYYVREAHFGAVDVVTAPLRVSGSPSDSLSIDFSAKGGQLQGAVKDERQQTVGRATVALIPDIRRDHRELYKSATTDANGNFTLGGIAPGDYKLFAWENLDANAFFSAEILRPFETKGMVVHIAESSKQTVEVRAIRSGLQP